MLLNMLQSLSVLQEFQLLGYEVWKKLTNELEDENSSASTIKMKEPTKSYLI